MARILISLVFCLAVVMPLWSSDGLEGLQYQEPPQALADLVDAESTPRVYVSPDREWALYIDRPLVKTIREVAARELRLAGLRIDPDRYTRSRAVTYRNPRLQSLGGGGLQTIDGLPDVPLTSPNWSPTSKHVALGAYSEAGLVLYIVDVSTQKARAFSGPELNAVYADAFQWLPDGSGLLCMLRTDAAPAKPELQKVPKGPVVQVSTGEKAPVRTYQDLLSNAHDADLLEHYITSQLVSIKLDGTQQTLSEPAMYAEVSPAPNGQYLLVERIVKPFSYLVPIWRFASETDVLNRDGGRVARVANLALAENIPKGFDAVREGRRRMFWRQDKDAVLAWVEAVDGGDPAKETDVRDRVYTLAAPFDGEPVVQMDLGLRLAGIAWSNGDSAMLTEYWWTTRQTRTWMFAPDHPEQTPKKLFDISMEDRYNSPGSPVMQWSDGGQLLHRLADGRVLMMGDGASPEGERPFVSALDTTTGESEKLWQSQAPYYEEPFAILDDQATSFLITRETPSENPNFYRSDRERNVTPLTSFPHPAPAFRDISKTLISYEREDGVQLSGELYLPAGYDKDRDGRLPLLMWAYPREYKSADAAGQMQGSPYEFSNVSYWGPMPYLAAGYAVLSRPTMPIVGEGDQEPNDTFVQQLVAGAAAAIDAVVERGIADRDRVAIGGHSYGAFMVANLLAHSDLFRAGIARSGAYNRSLTPFGFQAEQRSFWEAQHIYARMSPFFNAEKIDEPMLMIHGEEDNNSGTYPLQSRRMFQALKGLGVPARLVMLPHESHGYRARESLLHMMWEQHRWLETHVKPVRKGDETPAAKE